MPRITMRVPGVALALLALVAILAPGAAWAGRAGIDPDGVTMDGRGGIDPDGATPAALRTSTDHRAGFDPNGVVATLRSRTEHRSSFDPDGRV